MLSNADRRLGAVDEDVPVCEAGDYRAPERGPGVHVVRDAAASGASGDTAEAVTPLWVQAWQRSIRLQRGE